MKNPTYAAAINNSAPSRYTIGFSTDTCPDRFGGRVGRSLLRVSLASNERGVHLRERIGRCIHQSDPARFTCDGAQEVRGSFAGHAPTSRTSRSDQAANGATAVDLQDRVEVEQVHLRGPLSLVISHRHTCLDGGRVRFRVGGCQRARVVAPALPRDYAASRHTVGSGTGTGRTQRRLPPFRAGMGAASRAAQTPFRCP